MPRFSVSADAANDRAVLWGSESGNFPEELITAGSLSGGMFQRVRIVRTFINGLPCSDFGVPDRVILDKTLSAGVRYLKINSGELLSVTGASDPEAAAAALLGRFPLECAAITDGPARAFIVQRGSVHRISIPPVPGIRNPLGAGDVCSGVMFSELLAGADSVQAFAAGLAAACASCLTQYAAEFDRAEALLIRDEMRIEAVSPGAA